MKRNSKALLIFAVVVVATIIYSKTHEKKVTPRQDKLAQMIQISVDAAGSKNQQAVRLCEADINTILDQQFSEYTRQGKGAAEDLATYGSCCKIISLMAIDKIKGSNTTIQYVDERIQSHLNNSSKKLSGDLETAIGRFELSLKGNTVGLAQDLAQINPSNATAITSLPVDLKTNLDINQAIRNFGFNVTENIISLSFDISAVLRTPIVKALVSDVVRIAGRLFAKQAAEAAAEGAVASAGPETLGIADGIAILGAMWTAHDIYSSQKQFEQDMKQSVDNMMSDVHRKIQKQVLDQVHAILEEHQQMQDKIRQQAEEQLMK